MNYYIPDTDPIIMAWINELTRWVADNWVTILIATNILTALKVAAMKTKNVYDDKIVTFLLYVVSFKWLKDMTAGLGTKENPYVLKDQQ